MNQSDRDYHDLGKLIEAFLAETIDPSDFVMKAERFLKRAEERGPISGIATTERIEIAMLQRLEGLSWKEARRQVANAATYDTSQVW